MEGLRGSGIAAPVDGFDEHLGLFLDLFDQRLQGIGLREAASRISKRARHKTWFEIAIQQRAQACGQFERGEKILIEFAAADDVESSVANRQGTNRGEGKSDAVWKLFAFQECRGAAPVFCGGNPFIFVANARGILRGGNQRAIGVHKFHEIEAVILGGAVGVVNVQGRVCVGARQIESHAQGDIGIGNILDLLSDCFAALHKFLVELCNQRFGALDVHFFEGALGVIGDAIGHQRDGGQYGNQKNRKDFSSETHGRTPAAGNFAGFFAASPSCKVETFSFGSSHTSARRHSPQEAGSQLRTSTPSPAYSGKITSGRMRRSSMKWRSLSYKRSYGWSFDWPASPACAPSAFSCKWSWETSASSSRLGEIVS